jgi:protoheme IX farnesyltransferase
MVNYLKDRTNSAIYVAKKKEGAYLCQLPKLGMKTAIETADTNSLALALADFKEITKARLAISVVFSSIAGFLLGADVINLSSLALLGFGGYCMVGASNAFNQVIEKDLDALMKRTRNRPIPGGRMSVNTAMTIAIVMTLLGVVTLYILNPKTAMFGAISIFLYTCVYTPLKTKTPLSVFVGAFPGAIPFMLGWVAATDDFGIEPGTLFMIQFFWQFPHFWALGWMLHDDYKLGGFKMLPTGKKDKGTAIQIIMYTIWMIVISVIPVFGITGGLHLSIPAAVLVFLMGLVMLFFAMRLFEKRDNGSAKRLMLASVSYITLMQLVYVADKFL